MSVITVQYVFNLLNLANYLILAPGFCVVSFPCPTVTQTQSHVSNLGISSVIIIIINNISFHSDLVRTPLLGRIACIFTHSLFIQLRILRSLVRAELGNTDVWVLPDAIW